MGLSKLFRVSKKLEPLSILVECKGLQNALLFESDVVAVLSQYEADNIRKQYVKTLEAYCSLGVLRVKEDFGFSLHLILVTGCGLVGRIQNSEIYRVTDVTEIPLNKLVDQEDLAVVHKLLCSGTFYFSRPTDGTNKAIDLTQSMQSQQANGIADDKFLWNKSLLGHLERFGVDCSIWVMNIICGSVDVKTVYAGDKTSKVVVLSRLSCERAGTRFNTRGVDDDGNVANFVETEQILLTDADVTSFLQLRGTVPLFWEQPRSQTGTRKIKMSRGYEASAQAFERHFAELLDRYGPQLILNLLGLKEGESMLSSSYKDHLKHSRYKDSDDVDMISFDYHQNKSRKEKMDQLLSTCDPKITSFGFYHQEQGTVTKQQVGTVRTNCKDCIDRTNTMQTILALHMLPNQLKVMGLSDKPNIMSRFEECLKTLWSSNGDHISRIYAGTAALDGKTKVGKLMDGAKSVNRSFQNSFMDANKQESIDLLLQGNVYTGFAGSRARALLPFGDVASSPGLVEELCARYKEYTTTSTLRVSVGTWNVNGGRYFRSIALQHQSMHDWLLDAPKLQPQKSDQPVKLVQLTTTANKEPLEGDVAPPRPPLPEISARKRRGRSKSPLSNASSLSVPAQMAAIEDSDLSLPVDIFAVGFEELVDLSTSNIISASSTNKKEWGAELERVLSRDEQYVLLTAEQLVGVCLYIFVRPILLPYIRDVGVATVKTGLSGAAGNKGAVAIRFLVYGSSMCFICGHLTAGQSNVKDRNQDFADISKRLAFARGYTADCHDYVFWCGDFNYRIDMPLADVKELVKDENWKILQAYDQLNVERKKGSVFQGFIEGPTNFAPTYKYDMFSDDYDTSEKLRTPAWTDRVLWKRARHSRQATTGQVGEDVAQIAAAVVRRSKAAERGETEEWNAETEGMGSKKELSGEEKEGASWSPGRLLYYNRAELKTSDHRPVVAILDIDIEQVDVDKRQSISEEVRLMMGPPDPTIIVKGQKDSSDADLAALDPVLLMTVFQSFGEVLMVRLLETKTYITFQDARSAVAALELDKKEIEGVIISVKLKCPWPPSTLTNASDVPPHSPSPDGHMPSRLTVITSEQVQKISSSPHSSPLPSPSQSPSSSPLLPRKRYQSKQLQGKISPLADAMDVLDKPESSEANGNDCMNVNESGIRIEVTGAEDEESCGDRLFEAVDVETSLTEFLSDEEPSFDKKNETAEDILKEVESDLAKGSSETDGEMIDLERIIAEGRKAMAECTARASAKEKKKLSRPSRPPQPKPYSTSAVEAADAVHDTSPVASSKPSRPTQLATSPVKGEAKVGKAAISQSPNSTRPGSAKTSPSVSPLKSSPSRPAKPSRRDLPSPFGKAGAQKPPAIPVRRSSLSSSVEEKGKKEESINTGEEEPNEFNLTGSPTGNTSVTSSIRENQNIKSNNSEKSNKTYGDDDKPSVATELRKSPTKPKPYRPPPPKPERLPAVLRPVKLESSQESETTTVAVAADNSNKQPVHTDDAIDLTKSGVNYLAVDADEKAYKEAAVGALTDSVFLEDVLDDQTQPGITAEVEWQSENQFDGKATKIEESKQADFVQKELQEVETEEEILRGHAGDPTVEVSLQTSPIAGETRDGYEQQEENKSDETPVNTSAVTQKLPWPQRPQPPIRTNSLDTTREKQQAIPKGNTNTPNPSERSPSARKGPVPAPKPKPKPKPKPRPPRPPAFSAKK